MGRRRVQMGGGLVEQQDRRVAVQPQQCAGHRHPLSLPCGQSIDAVVTQMRGSRFGQRFVDVSRQIRLVGGGQFELVGDRASGEGGTLRNPRDAPPPFGRVELGDIHVAAGDRAAFRGGEAEEHRHRRRLPAAARTDSVEALQPHDLAGPRDEAQPVRREPVPPPHPQRSHSQSSRAVAGNGRFTPVGEVNGPPLSVRRKRAVALTGGSAHELVDSADGFHAVLAGVVGGSGRAQRQVALRGQHQNQQSGGQIEVAGDQSQADADGHHRHRQRRKQLQDQRGEEGDAQGRDRGAPVRVADPADDLALRPCPPEGRQHRKRPDQLQQPTG